MMTGKRVLEHVLNAATIVAFAGALFLGWPLLAKHLGNRLESQLLTSEIGRQWDSLVVGSAVGDSTVQLRGRHTVIYIFTTTCPFCKAQKEHIRAFLLSLDQVQVLSVTPDTSDAVPVYWHGPRASTQLPAPLLLTEVTVDQMDLRSVPRLYVVNEHGVVEVAVAGSVLGVSHEDLRDFLFR